MTFIILFEGNTSISDKNSFSLQHIYKKMIKMDFYRRYPNNPEAFPVEW